MHTCPPPAQQRGHAWPLSASLPKFCWFHGPGLLSRDCHQQGRGQSHRPSQVTVCGFLRCRRPRLPFRSCSQCGQGARQPAAMLPRGLREVRAPRRADGVTAELLPRLSRGAVLRARPDQAEGSTSHARAPCRDRGGRDGSGLKPASRLRATSLSHVASSVGVRTAGPARWEVTRSVPGRWLHGWWFCGSTARPCTVAAGFAAVSPGSVPSPRSLSPHTPREAHGEGN